MTHIDVVIRLTMAMILGGVIGLEREMQSQPAGLRTHIILCVGSTLIMLVSLFVYYNIGDQNFDPARIAAQIVTGIGFLGAGAIMRLGVSVKGLTTAANMWATAGVGMAVGVGFYTGAVYSTFIMLIVLRVLNHWARRFLSTKHSRKITIVVKENADILGDFEEILSRHHTKISAIKFSKDIIRGSLKITAVTNTPKKFNTAEISRDLSSIKDLLKLYVE